MRLAARTVLKAANTSALLVSDLVNVRYLTGVCVSSGVVLVLPSSFLFFVDSRYREMAEENRLPGVSVRDIAGLEKAMTTVRICGFESAHVTVESLQRWKKKFKNTKFVQVRGAVECFRRSKDKEELLLIGRSARITAELLRRIPASLRAGITERALAWKIEQWARELGAESMSFDPIVAFGAHTSRPHHRPTTKRLQRGHIVQIDIGVKYRGYCSDRSCVYFTGKISAEYKRAYQAVREAKDTAKRAVKAGMSTRALDRIARDVLKKYDMEKYFTHSLGHGVGLEIHEGVSLSAKAPDVKLLKNEVITIEPGVYVPGKFGMRVEDMVFVM